MTGHTGHEMELIKLADIISESNRKYTKDGGFEQLKNSIKTQGIIQSPIVRPLEKGRYKIIDGRRRVEAARQLKFKEITCEIREDEYEAGDEALALSANVNRLEMHPLDEAAAFRILADEGKSVEDIAKYYARSASAIYKRLRLVSLIDELKAWFRDGVLDISGAALLAELPEDDQKKFYEQEKLTVENNVFINDDESISNYKISDFIYKNQRFKVKPVMGEKCRDCPKRTHNSENDLFEEFSHLDDVCLDADCYRAVWYELIETALAEEIRAAGIPTDAKIWFRDGVPEMLYKKASHANFTNDEGSIKYEVIKPKKYVFAGKTDRKKNACWMISEIGLPNSTGHVVQGKTGLNICRVAYKEKEKEEKTTEKSKGSDGGRSYFFYDSIGKAAFKELAEGRGMKPDELEKTLDKKKVKWNFSGNIESKVGERIISERLKDTAPRNYFNMFLKYKDADNLNNNKK